MSKVSMFLICITFFYPLHLVLTKSLPGGLVNQTHVIPVFLEFENETINDPFESVISEIFSSISLLNDFIIHYDTFTASFVNNIMKKANYKIMATVKKDMLHPIVETTAYKSPVSPVTILFNYDEIPSAKSIMNIMRRNTIHIISLVNYLRFDVLMKEDIRSSDVIIFLCQKHYGTCKTAYDEESGTFDKNILINSTFLNKSFLTLVVEFSDSHVRLYEVCYYCNELAKELFLHFEKKMHPGLNSFENDLSFKIMKIVKEKKWNFKGYTFKIGVTHHEDLNFRCKNPQKTSVQEDLTTVSCEDTLRSEGYILAELKTRLQFNTEFLFFEKSKPYENMVNVVRDSRVNWAVGSISVTGARMSKVDFAKPVKTDPYKVVYGIESSFFKEGLSLFFVFSVSTWILLFGTLIAQSCIVYLSNIIISKEGTKSFSEVIWIVGFTLTEQSYSVNMKTFAGHKLFLWLLCSINISTLYKAKLTSFITKPLSDELRNLDQLVKEGYGLTSMKFGIIEQMLNSSSDKTLQKLSRRVTIRPEICRNLKDTIGTKQMVIDVQDDINWALNRECRQNGIIEQTDLINLRITQDDIFPSDQAWAFQKSTPFISFLNRYIIRFHEFGLIKKWNDYSHYTNASVYFDGRTIFVDKSETMDRKNKFYGQYVLWIIGIGLSCAVFIGEVVIKLCYQWD